MGRKGSQPEEWGTEDILTQLGVTEAVSAE